MGKIIVRPSDELIKENRVALWDQDPVHAECDPRWDESGYNGAFIAGDSRKPDATYVVVETAEVSAALRAQRLIKVGEYVPPAAPGVVETAEPVAATSDGEAAGDGDVDPDADPAGDAPAAKPAAKPAASKKK